MTEVEQMNEITFWSRQLSEHGLFVSKALQAGKDELESLQLEHLIQDGLDLSNQWDEIFQHLNSGQDLPADQVMSAFDMLDSYLIQVLDVASKTWIGYSFPSVLKHYRQELNHARRYAQGEDIPVDELALFWKDIHKDHAALFAHLLDPSEEEAFKESLLYKEIFDLDWTVNQDVPELDHFIELTQQFDDFNAFTATLRERQAVGKLQSVIHPRLALHIHREGLRSLMNLRG